MTNSPHDLCVRFVELLPVTGASISIISDLGGKSTIAITDSVAARLEQLQFDLGEGPHWEALRTGKPALVPDVRAEQAERWPMFSLAIAELRVAALFALPLTIGAVTVGVVDLYRSTSGALLRADLTAGLTLAASISEQALRYAAASAHHDEPEESPLAPAMRREVHQATGMVLVQLNISATEAFSRLQARAFSEDRPLTDVALDVVQRKLDFSVRAD